LPIILSPDIKSGDRQAPQNPHFHNPKPSIPDRPPPENPNIHNPNIKKAPEEPNIRNPEPQLWVKEKGEINLAEFLTKNCDKL